MSEKRRANRHWALFVLEPVEPRVMLASFIVTSKDDSGAGTLRQAILDSNISPGADTLLFNLPSSGIETISVSSALPPISDPLFLDGASQPGYAGTPLIELNGGNAPSGTTGLLITAGNTTVRGLIINGFKFDGIELASGGGNSIYANWIGTDKSSSGALANLGVGIYINNSANNTIGGNSFTVGASSFSARNIISGNLSDGILIQGGLATANVVRGNYIGLRLDGTDPIANRGNGIEITGGAHDNIIGGSAIEDRNVISGNSRDGIQISADGTAGNLIQGNYIGLRPDGNSAQGNGRNGVAISGLFASAVSGNVIGGSVAGAGNVISGNLGDGVQISEAGATANSIEGNYIGTDANGSSAVPNNNGVNIVSAVENTVGGTTPAARNIISGNRLNGVEIQDGAIGNLVRGNYIGLRPDGSTMLANQGDGVDINSSSGNVIGGPDAGAGNVISGNGSDGVEIAADINRFTGDSTSNLVQGNLIGTDAAGTAARPNVVNGVRLVENTCRVDENPHCAGLFSSVGSNAIGGTAAAERNVISGNGANGIHIIGTHATANRVSGNYIGADITGAGALGNSGSGVAISGAIGNFIGGTAAGAGNVISANRSDGVSITSLLSATPPIIASANELKGNLIGTAANGSSPLGNARVGVQIVDSSQNIIGGTEDGAANTIAFNGASASTSAAGGVYIQATTGAADRNSIRRNRIFSNAGPIINSVPTGLGIDLGPAGVTSNDTGDADSGPNGRQNFPTLTAVSSDVGGTRIDGTFNSTPNASFDLEFFSSPAADPTGFGEGASYLGSAVINTNSTGDATFSIVVPSQLPQGTLVTATATNEAGDTSEFSNAIAVSTQINGEAGDDIIRLVRSAADSALLHVFVNNAGATPSYSLNYNSLSQISINGLAGNDILILDYAHGEVITSGGISYDGGASTSGDALEVIGLSPSDTFTASTSAVAHGPLSLTHANIEELRLGAGHFTVNSDLNGLSLSVDTMATALLAATQHISSLTIGASAVVRLAGGGTSVLVVNSLSIAQSAGVWSGTLDLADNDLIIHASASTRAQVLSRAISQIQSGRNSGSTPSTRWQGTGIASSAASLEPSGTTGLAVMLNEKPDGVGGTTTLRTNFAGESVDINAILVKYTYTGDADIDGDVDADDYAHIDAGFANRLSEYRNGDFDYSGGIDADDYFLIDRAFSNQGSALAIVTTPAASSASSVAQAPLKKTGQARPRGKKPRHHRRALRPLPLSLCQPQGELSLLSPHFARNCS